MLRIGRKERRETYGEVKMGRPRKPIDVVEVLLLRFEGLSWPEIARRLRLGYGTTYQAYPSGAWLLQ